jgi:3-ketoacyl-CoA synthase
VTTPPSKGLVVELYLIYFGLAQSFVDLLFCHLQINLSTLDPSHFEERQGKMSVTIPTKPVYLMDFACYKPPEAAFMGDVQKSVLPNCPSPEIAEFFYKVVQRSGLSTTGTYMHPVVLQRDFTIEHHHIEEEAKMVYFGCTDELFKKSNFNAQDVDVLVTLTSTYCPIPSLASMMVHHYKMREDCHTYHLGGMGCSMGVIAMGLVHDLLKARPGSVIMIVFAEMCLPSFYRGKEKNRIVSNALFRMGSTCTLYTDRMWVKGQQAKLQLTSFVRIHTGGVDEGAFACIQQSPDPEGILGMYLGKDLPAMVGKAVTRILKLITPRIMTWGQYAEYMKLYLSSRISGKKMAHYMPDYTKCCQHFLMHAGGYGVLKALQKALNLPSETLLPSFSALRDYGNLSASTTWYAMAYIESMGFVKKDQVIMQLGIGGGVEAGVAMWRAVRDVQDPHAIWVHLNGKATKESDLPRKIDEDGMEKFGGLGN